MIPGGKSPRSFLPQSGGASANPAPPPVSRENPKVIHMQAPAMLLTGLSLVVTASAPIPTYDVKPTCRTAIALSGVAGRTAEMCEASEAQARAEIVKAWSTFTEASKDRCLKTVGVRRPSYIELVVCLESVRDQQKRLKQEQVPARRLQSR